MIYDPFGPARKANSDVMASTEDTGILISVSLISIPSIGQGLQPMRDAPTSSAVNSNMQLWQICFPPFCTKYALGMRGRLTGTKGQDACRVLPFIRKANAVIQHRPGLYSHKTYLFNMLNYKRSGRFCDDSSADWTGAVFFAGRQAEKAGGKRRRISAFPPSRSYRRGG